MQLLHLIHTDYILLLLVLAYGTIYLRTLPPHRRCLVFTFKRRLKMHLFRLSYPDLIFNCSFVSYRGPCSSCLLLRPCLKIMID